MNFFGGNGIFHILEPSAFKKCSIGWVLKVHSLSLSVSLWKFLVQRPYLISLNPLLSENIH